MMKQVVADFVAAFRHSAVTYADLLCFLAARLAGCPPDRLETQPECTSMVQHVGSNATASKTAVVDGCNLLPKWFQRLNSWLQQPGVQTVLLHSLEPGVGEGQQIRVEALPSNLPGQARLCVDMRFVALLALS
jgi:hypothetical protein